MESKVAHVHMSRAAPTSQAHRWEVKRPRTNWKRHRRANSCALTTERPQGLEPAVSCLAHSPRGKRDILFVWATSARSACLFLEAILRDRVGLLVQKKKGCSLDSVGTGSSQSTHKGALWFSLVLLLTKRECMLARVRPRIPQIGTQSG